MRILKDDINKCLDFYNIKGKDYIIKCRDCFNTVFNDKKLFNKFNKVYNLLYNNKNEEIRPLWKEKDLSKFLDNNYDPFINNLLLLCGYKYHFNNIKKYNLSEKQIIIHKQRIKECLTNDIYKRGLPGIRLSQLLWGVYFINIRLIEVGRLQYEYYKDEKNEYIKIHIPPNKNLDYNEAIESIKESKKEIKKHFNIDNPTYYCDSWLLSKDITPLLNKNSNIRKFQQLFEIKSKEECTDDILKYVYNITECDNYQNLQEKTSLQKGIKKLLLNDRPIKLGQGILIKKI